MFLEEISEIPPRDSIYKYFGYVFLEEIHLTSSIQKYFNSVFLQYRLDKQKTTTVHCYERCFDTLCSRIARNRVSRDNRFKKKCKVKFKNAILVQSHFGWCLGKSIMNWLGQSYAWDISSSRRYLPPNASERIYNEPPHKSESFWRCLVADTTWMS